MQGVNSKSTSKKVKGIRLTKQDIGRIAALARKLQTTESETVSRALQALDNEPFLRYEIRKLREGRDESHQEKEQLLRQLQQAQHHIRELQQQVQARQHEVQSWRTAGWREWLAWRVFHIPPTIRQSNNR